VSASHTFPVNRFYRIWTSSSAKNSRESLSPLRLRGATRVLKSASSTRSSQIPPVLFWHLRCGDRQLATCNKRIWQTGHLGPAAVCWFYPRSGCLSRCVFVRLPDAPRFSVANLPDDRARVGAARFVNLCAHSGIRTCFEANFRYTESRGAGVGSADSSFTAFLSALRSLVQ